MDQSFVSSTWANRQAHRGRRAQVVALVMFASFANFCPSVAQQPGKVSPSFDCSSPAVSAQPLPQIICSNDQLASAEFAYVMAFYALRHTLNDQAKNALTAESDAFIRRVVTQCSLPTAGRLGREPTSREVSCVEGQLTGERDRIVNRLPLDAREELALKPVDAKRVQELLIAENAMPANSTIDGKFGPATRIGIADWQKTNGEQSTGFASRQMLEKLSGTSTQPDMPACDRYAAVPGDRGLPAGVRGVWFDQIDAEKAVSVCQQAVNERPDDARLLYQLGRSLYAQGNISDALASIRKSADLGYVRALTALGGLYAEGKGVGKDDTEAIRLFRKSTELGDPAAMIELGARYQYGSGVPKDEAEAFRLYRRGAEAGYLLAMDSLGHCYENGIGVGKDEREAVHWYKKAVSGGALSAMARLGLMYHQGRGVQQDFGEAIRLYRKAAARGNALATNNLGVIYENGSAVKRDYVEAARLYQKAADLGLIDAMYISVTLTNMA
ncbi:hypothetical protein BH10PSE6_BH10PSE6_45470 [soil metagenome]